MSRSSAGKVFFGVFLLGVLLVFVVGVIIGKKGVVVVIMNQSGAKLVNLAVTVNGDSGSTSSLETGESYRIALKPVGDSHIDLTWHIGEVHYQHRVDVYISNGMTGEIKIVVGLDFTPVIIENEVNYY